MFHFILSSRAKYLLILDLANFYLANVTSNDAVIFAGIPDHVTSKLNQVHLTVDATGMREMGNGTCVPLILSPE